MDASAFQAFLPPVVIISACGLLCLAQFARLAAIVSRLRQFHHERFDVAVRLSRPGQPDGERKLLAERFNALAEQAQRVLSRARKTRRGLVGLVCAVLAMVLSSLLIGLSPVWPTALSLAFGLFVLGLLCMFVGMSFVLAELLDSLDMVTAEHHRQTALPAAELAVAPPPAKGKD